MDQKTNTTFKDQLLEKNNFEAQLKMAKALLRFLICTLSKANAFLGNLSAKIILGLKCKVVDLKKLVIQSGVCFLIQCISVDLFQKFSVDQDFI